MLRVFENRVLRRIFGPKREEETGEWRQLHNEELNDLYSTPNTIRMIKSTRMKWIEHVARKGENRVVYRVLVGKPGGKRPLGKCSRRLEFNIKMDFQEVGWVKWSGLIWLKIETVGGGTCECDNESSRPIKRWAFVDYLRTG